MGKSHASRTAWWLVVALCLGIALTLVAVRAVPALALAGSDSESRDARVVDAITREEQVVLLSLGIEGIAEQTERGSFLGIDVPGSGRATFVQYGFRAKLGIDGDGVRISRVGEDALVISVPEFVFIGHDDESFRTVIENNGVLSWVTPQIDTAEMITTILDGDAQEQYIEANTDVLEDQARAFYTGIVNGIDPHLTVMFEFR